MPDTTFPEPHSTENKNLKTRVTPPGSLPRSAATGGKDEFFSEIDLFDHPDLGSS